MTNTFGTHVSGAPTAMHSGSGNLFVTFDPGSLLVDSRGKTPRKVAEDELRRLHQRFVPPEGFGAAREVLETRGTVLLDGVPGSGRDTVARMLLRQLPGGTGPFHELVPDAEKGPYLDPGQIGDGDQLLLNLSTAEEPLWNAVQDELSAFRATLTERRAHLVVVLPHHRVTRTHNAFASFLAELGRPSGLRVLRRSLGLDGIDHALTEPLPAPLADYLAKEPPVGEIARLAVLIERARSTDRDGRGFPEWCGEALTAVMVRDRDITRLVAERREGPQRALLLTTAMLHGAHADAVHQGAAAMLRTMGSPADDRPLLERADLVERFQEIDAEAGAGGAVRFTKLGYEPAVRAHFWHHMPELRDPLRSWVADAVTLPRLGSDDRDELVRRFTEQCLRTGHTEALVGLVSRWTSAPRDNNLLRAAAKTLESGLRDEVYGRRFRKKIWDWSREEGLSARLRDVLIGVCSEVMAVRHPDEALVRLHHLARRQRHGSTAAEALLRLVRSDHRLRRRMLDRLADGLVGHSWPTDAELFLEVTEPDALIDPGTRNHGLLAEPGVRSRLVTGWSVVFRVHPHHGWTERVESWLLTACRRPDHREALLDVLLEGSVTRGETLGRLYVIARDWAPRAGDAREKAAALVDTLFQKINIAQGIQETAP
ncbi:hypothetical protein ABVG11_34725 [Streptomyces sp. HD1123-B1]|uniref:hypothetical protein n=1 Tax=Streptomyces huangiella TaxID=3228804 RepID=UPI003D7DCBD9